jgi:hypothetical protein
MDGAVRLKLARREFWSGGGMSGTYAPISAKVKNIAFAKDVAVHYTPDGVTWKDHPLSFTSHFGDYDIFGGTVNEQVSQFVIRYSVAGNTYYDNKSGQNYLFTSNLAVVGGNVVLYKATARRGMEAGGGFTFVTSWLEGEILVNNLSFAKQVGVRMSADGGASWSDTQGSFAGDHIADGVFVGTGAEVWKFKTSTLNLDNSSTEFRFAVFYRNLATGETSWDNNFGQDYKVGKADGTTIE